MSQNGVPLTHSPLLITGFARSGTTALAAGIHINNRLFFNEAGFFSGVTLPSIADVRRHILRRVKVRFGKYIPVDLSSLRKKLAAPLGKDCRRELMKRAYSFVAGLDLEKVPFTEDHSKDVETLHLHMKTRNRQDGKYWGDKIPKLILQTDLRKIKELWPDLKLIYIYRDGRDVVASHIRLGWSNPENVWSSWIRSLEEWYRLEMDHLVVRQEDMIHCLPTVVARLNTYLGESAVSEADYQTYFYKKGIIADNCEVTHRSDHANHIGYWKAYFSMHEVPSTAKAWLGRLGYL